MALIGLNEAIVIGAVLLALILGPKKLPQLARSLGESEKEYRKSMQEAEEVAADVKDEADQVAEDVSVDAEDEVKDVKDSDG